MQTFDQSLFDLFEANVIGYEDALRNADSVNDLRLQIKLSSQRAKTNDLSSGTEHFRHRLKRVINPAARPAYHTGQALFLLERKPTASRSIKPAGLGVNCPTRRVHLARGPGRLGYPMARHLATAGTRSRCTTVPLQNQKLGALNLRALQAKTCKTPREAAQDAEIVFCCVGNDDDLRSVVLGSRWRLCRHAARRHLRGSHHGLRPRWRRELYAAAKKLGLQFIPLTPRRSGSPHRLPAMRACGAGFLTPGVHASATKRRGQLT